MVKYKSRAPKAQLTSVEADKKAKEEKEEAERVEGVRLEAERFEAQRRRREWEARPGPVPIGWDSAIDQASGREFYWQLDNAQTTTTWDRPDPSGEKIAPEDLQEILEEYRHTDKLPRPGMFALCLQRLWDKETVDPVCNHERPGSLSMHGEPEMVAGLTLLRYILRGPRKFYQDLLARARMVPHEKLPPHLHRATAIQRLVDLLRHKEAIVQQGAANAIAAACFGGHRPCQDAIFMSGNAMPALIRMLDTHRLTQAACLAIGRLCELTHKGNQDALLMVQHAAENLLHFLEDEDEGIARAVKFAVFWSCAGSSKATRHKWERSRGLCLSLTEPKVPIADWSPSKETNSLKELQDISEKHKLLHIPEVEEVEYRKTTKTSMTSHEKAVHLFDKAPEPDDVPHNSLAKKKAKESRQIHLPISTHQDPAHVHMHLTTKRAAHTQHEHEKRHDSKKKAIQEARAKCLSDAGSRIVSREGSKVGSRENSREGGERPKALCDGGDGDDEQDATGNQLALADPSRQLTEPTMDAIQEYLPNDGRQHRKSLLAFEYGDIVADANEETSSEEEDHDIHHLDPALEDEHVCRIGGEARFVAATGFLHPTNVNKRYGICT